MARRARTNDAAALLRQLEEMFGKRLANPIRLSESMAPKTVGAGCMVWDLDAGSELAVDLLHVVAAIVEKETT